MPFEPLLLGFVHVHGLGPDQKGEGGVKVLGNGFGGAPILGEMDIAGCYDGSRENDYHAR